MCTLTALNLKKKVIEMTQENKFDITGYIENKINAITSFFRTISGKDPWEFGTDLKGRCDTVITLPFDSKIKYAKIIATELLCDDPKGGEFTSSCQLIYEVDGGGRIIYHNIHYELYEDAYKDLEALQSMM